MSANVTYLELIWLDGDSPKAGYAVRMAKICGLRLVPCELGAYLVSRFDHILEFLLALC